MKSNDLFTLENDDKNKGYTVQDLYSVYERIGTPIVLDTLHWLQFWCFKL